MKKKINAICALCLGLLIGTVSCTSFLEETSPDITIPTTVQHFEELLYGEGYPIAQTAIAEVLSDNAQFNYGPSDTRDFRAINFIPLYLWEKDVELWQANVLSPLWTNSYRAISVCNLVLEGLAELPPSPERDHVLGQAHVLRAHHYFNLVNFFGEPFRKGGENRLGVPLKTTAVAEDIKLPRNTVEEVYELISSDLDRGIIMLKKDDNSPLKGEVNYATALTLASRVALYLEDYEKVLSLGNLYLALRIPMINASDNLADGKYVSVQNKEVTMLFGGSYNEMSSVFLNTQLAGRSSLVVADEVFDLYQKDLRPEETDQRLSWFFTTSSNGLRYPKKSATNKRHAYRAAEIYLNMAEAHFALNQPEQSLELLNTLRRTRIDGYTDRQFASVGLTGLEELIEDERRREFSFEDHRWFDLRRYNRSISHEYVRNETHYRVTLSENDWGYTLQVPMVEQNRNPNIELIPHTDRQHEQIN